MGGAPSRLGPEPEHAVELAKGCPIFKNDGTVEVRRFKRCPRFRSHLRGSEFRILASADNVSGYNFFPPYYESNCANFSHPARPRPCRRIVRAAKFVAAASAR